MTTTKLMARAVFGGDLRPDPQSAAAALRAAGYTVFTLPDKHPILLHPLDDFLECVIDGPDDDDPDDKIVDAVMREVEGIVHLFGGICESCGPIDADYVPFAELFEDVLPAAPDDLPPYAR